MKLSSKFKTRIIVVILGISMLSWIALIFNPGNITVEHCNISASGPSAASLQMLLEMNPISSQLIGWGLMVVAMMLPKLTMPILHIYGASLNRRRLPLSLIFVLGYMAVWLATGIFMIAVILVIHLIMPSSYVPAIVLGVVSIVWQFSPIKQRCLNEGHMHRTLAVFGWVAYSDALLFGLYHGLWCVGAGWAIMLFPMLLPHGHNIAMVVITFIMLSEHFERPQRPRWHVNLRIKLFHYAVAQLRIKSKNLLRNVKAQSHVIWANQSGQVQIR